MDATEQEMRKYPIRKLNVDNILNEKLQDANSPPLPPEHPPCCVHSELIASNPSMIPNDGERVVLLSLVSRVEKNMMVKNDVMSGRFFQSIYRVNSNINLIQIVLLIFLQIECEWILKKYQVDNMLQTVLSIFLQIGCNWILKKYRVDNNPVDSFPTSASVDTTISQRDENDPVDSFPTSAFVDTIKLEGSLNQYRVDHYNKTVYDESILCKNNDCQVLLF